MLCCFDTYVYCDNLFHFGITEKLRRKDQMIRAALADKQRLVADILRVPHSELEVSSDSLSDSEGEKEARMLVMTAIAQGEFRDAFWNVLRHIHCVVVGKVT